MPNSQNGWPVIEHSETVKWIIPVKKGESRHLILRPGLAAFLLVHFVLWYHEKIEAINLGIWDEWGWAKRPIRGSSVISNHASGTAVDVNATKHPLGKRGTLLFKVISRGKRYTAVARIQARLRFTYKFIIRGGYSYASRADEMHYEINVRPTNPKVTLQAQRLAKSPRGKRIIAVNPHIKPYLKG